MESSFISAAWFCVHARGQVPAPILDMLQLLAVRKKIMTVSAYFTCTHIETLERMRDALNKRIADERAKSDSSPVVWSGLNAAPARTALLYDDLVPLETIDNREDADESEDRTVYKLIYQNRGAATAGEYMVLYANQEAIAVGIVERGAENGCCVSRNISYTVRGIRIVASAFHDSRYNLPNEQAIADTWPDLIRWLGHKTFRLRVALRQAGIEPDGSISDNNVETPDGC